MNWIRAGAVSGALMVGLGAFGAHALEERLTVEGTEWWQTGALYHALHALALVACGLLSQVFPDRRRMANGAGWAFLLGTLFFSGSLYAMALGAPRWFGAITPIGGVLFLLGWVQLARVGR